MGKSGKYLAASIALFVLFIAFTAAVCLVDVKAIGPQGSSVGLAGINGAFAEKFAYNETFYKLTKYLGYLAILVVIFFAALGIMELVAKKSIGKVSNGILMLGALYVAVAVFYVLFNKVIVNYRPVLEDGALEASYPSSHTMLAVCVFISAAVQISRGRGAAAFKKICRTVFWALAVIMVVGRTISGVHWFTDIIGGVLLSAALLTAYCASLSYLSSKDPDIG
ncbi:MAG: phosphatase PAP2 family protein [Firmicutes bacterium]|jgi:undecaprenyl-diphosphatase|nr:phosphatase PAP2 family protein [Bacillota bacterium]